MGLDPPYGRDDWVGVTATAVVAIVVGAVVFRRFGRRLVEEL